MKNNSYICSGKHAEETANHTYCYSRNSAVGCCPSIRGIEACLPKQKADGAFFLSHTNICGKMANTANGAAAKQSTRSSNEVLTRFFGMANVQVAGEIKTVYKEFRSVLDALVWFEGLEEMSTFMPSILSATVSYDEEGKRPFCKFGIFGRVKC